MDQALENAYNNVAKGAGGLLASLYEKKLLQNGIS